MKRIITVTSLLLTFSVFGTEIKKPLPNYATSQELSQTLPSDWEIPALRSALSPSLGVRLPPEYEPVSAVVMTYAAYGSFLQNLSREIAAAGAKVILLGGPQSMPGVPADRYEAPPIGFNSIWSRDFGPVGIDEATGQLAIVDTVYRHYAYRKSDDAVPQKVAGYLGVQSYAIPLILDGGNVMVDSRGHLYMTERTYEWNKNLSREQVNNHLEDYFGVQKIHVLPYAKNGIQPADGTGHIDMFAKILDDCKVLVAKAESAPYQEPLEIAAQYFASTECAPGENWQVFRVKGWNRGRVWYTYTNSVIVNDTVIIPSYSSDNAQAAVDIYRQALPDHKHVTVNADQPIIAAGAIHCTTSQIPKL